MEKGTFDRMETNIDFERKKQRYEALDSIRGVVLISMILYHACWDLVYIFKKILAGTKAMAPIYGSKVYAGHLYCFQVFAGPWEKDL